MCCALVRYLRRSMPDFKDVSDFPSLIQRVGYSSISRRYQDHLNSYLGHSVEHAPSKAMILLWEDAGDDKVADDEEGVCSDRVES